MTDRDLQIYSIYIDAPAEKIWAAITTPEFSRMYGYTGDVSFDLTPGGRYQYSASEEMKQMGMPDIVVTGEVIEADPFRKLVQTWAPVWLAEEPAGTLTYEIEEWPGQQSRLTLIHDVTGAPETARQVGGGGDPGQGGGGWAWVLSTMKTAIETGRQAA